MAKEAPAAKQWRVRPSAPIGSMGTPDIPPIVAQVLHNRGISDSPGLNSFLNPDLHDPFLLSGMETACDRLYEAVQAGETIGVFGDFDVDGVTGTALVAEGLGDLGARVLPYIPDRLAEGHGLSEAAVLVLKESGVSVLVTVDCGVTAAREVALARDLGMDVVITDHHLPPPSLPPTPSIINPKLEVSDYPFPDLSGAGLAFKLVQGLCQQVGQPWKRELLELAALSTVADLVPLRGENRFLVKEGLKELRQTRRPGLQALYRNAGLRAESMDAESISYVIAPRLNSAGRLEHATPSYQLLLTRSVEEGKTLAERLGGLNRERQNLTEEAWTNVLEEVRGWTALPHILLVHDSGLSPGIAGLVASKLVDEFHRPAVVMSQADGVIRASARTIPEFDLIEDGLTKCGDLFMRYGGHRQAAGFQMHPENLPRLKDRLGRAAEEVLAKFELQPALDIDAEVSIANLPGQTFLWLKELEPFGVGNPNPAFLTRNVRLLDVRPLGATGRHLRLKLKEGRVVWDALAFRWGDKGIPDSALLDVVYNIGTDRRAGRDSLVLNVLDLRPSAG